MTEKKPRSGSITSDAANAVDESVIQKINQLTCAGSVFRESQSTVIKRLAEQIFELANKIPERLIARVAPAVELKKTKKRKEVSSLEETPIHHAVAEEIPSEAQNKKRKQRTK